MATRSYFTLFNAKFMYNSAESDSVLVALKTSSTNKFSIDSCQFISNVATSNTISFKDADGTIKKSVF